MADYDYSKVYEKKPGYDFNAVYGRNPTNVAHQQIYGFRGALAPLNLGAGRPAYTPPGATEPNSPIIQPAVTTQATAPNILVANAVQKTGAPVEQVASAFGGGSSSSTGIHAPPVINGVQTTSTATVGDGSKGGFLLAQDERNAALSETPDAFKPGGALYNEPNRAYPVGMARKIALRQAAKEEEA